MTTLEFFQLVLASEGTNYLALFRPGKKFPIHKPFDDLEQMAAALASYNRDPAYNGVYHACSSYKQPYIEVEKDGETRKKYRVPDNWNRAKAFWADIDCGEAKAEAGKGYPTKKDGVLAVFAFSKTIGWPKPLIVDSGNGVHAYWPLEKSIKAEAWVKVAALLKATMEHQGLLADPSRTADFASILRPVGSSNRKDPENPKKVATKNEATVSDAKTLAAYLQAFARENGVMMSLPKPSKLAAAANNLNSDLTAHLEFPSTPVNADVMAESCAQVRRVRDTMGDVSYEHWRYTIGLLTFCEDGRELAELWTSKREETGHDNLDWDVRYDTWNFGPTLCEKFEAENSEGCVGCPFKGKIKSPIVLGRVIPIAEEKTADVRNESDEAETVVIPALPLGYQWNSGVMSRVIPDKDGINQLYVFSQNLFYPTMRIRGEDGTYRIGMRMHLHNDRVRDFQMPFEAMASSSDILKSLAKYELMQTNHKEAGVHLTAYLRDSLEQLKRKVDETNTMTSYGWKDDLRGFLIGDRYYHQDGTVRRTLLGGYAASKASAVPAPKGTLEGYSKALNYVYDREGMVSLQYFILSGWGSLLNVFCEELYNGLLCAATGGDSGKGKTSAAYAGLYAFGEAGAIALKSGDAGTKNAIWATTGAFNNIPILFDEMTDMPAEELGTLAYTLSLGQERARLQASGAGGVKFANQATFRMSPYGTANNDLHGKLASQQANSQAEGVRMVQVRVDLYPIPILEATEVEMALAQMKANCGTAGDALVRYVVKNRDAVRERVREKVHYMVEHIPGTKYRFYRSHAACTVVIGEIAKELGIVNFNIEELQSFAVELMQLMAKSVDANNTVTTDDAFSRMVSELTPGIIVTTDFKDARTGGIGETPRNRVVGPVVGRWVLGTLQDRSKSGYLYLCQRAMRSWCTKNRTDFVNIIDHLRSAGALLSEDERVTLTRGTDLPRVQQRCVIVDTNKLERAAPMLVVDNAGVGSADEA